MAMSSLEPYGQRRGASPRDARGHDDERWHVRLTDDDVKLMTLEQLDDAYRLSIVDSETALWKPGMREWQPLRIVAGLEPDDEEAVEVDVEPEITRVGPTPYDVTPHAPVQRMLPESNPFLRSSPPRARSTPPPPRLVSTHRPAPVAPAPRSVVVPPAPRSVAPLALIPPAPTPAPSYPQPRAQMAWNPISVPPVALSVAPAPYDGKSSGGFGRLLLAAAFLAGSAVSLYRNDVLLGWARAGHIENQFLSAEQRLLGGPAFGTVRAVATSAALWEPTPTPTPVRQFTEASKPAPERETTDKTATALSTLPVAREGSALPEQPTASAIPATKAAAEPKPRAQPPSKPAAPPSPSRALQSRPTTSVAKNTPPTRTAAKATASPAATPVRLDEDPQPDARPPKSKKEVATPDLPLPPGAGAKATLDDAIRSAAARKTPKKKKSAASEYDPLNPDL
jgi:hypothetical protein